MTRFLLLFLFLSGVLCISGGGILLPEGKLLGGDKSYVTSDTLLLPVNESQDNEIRKEVPAFSLFLKRPSNVRDTVVYDPITKRYIFMTLIGNKYYYSRPYSQTLKEYLDSKSRSSIYEYNRQRIKEGSRFDSKGFASEIQFLDKLFDPIFGEDRINVDVKGALELTLGVKSNKVDNPALPVDQRKTTTLDFDEKIQFSIHGNISDLVKLDWNYDTEATFDFENQLKLNYEGKEDDIVKRIEAGNVSLPLAGTLITGGQNLWGFRTDLQFGKLSVSSIFSQQKGESNVIYLEKGAQKKEFELSAHNYEANRHFFLSKYFRDTYDATLQNWPVSSGIIITKIEVWVTNKSSRFEQARNVVGFVDLGENQANISNPIFTSTGGVYPDNKINMLYQAMTGTYSAIRDINKVTETLSPLLPGFTSGKDYEKLENARLLDPTEYTLNDKLGYISLNSALNADEVLAVAFEYTVRGEVFTVGELTASAPAAPSAVIVKMLKGTTHSPTMPTWDLMMKNVYNIGAFNLSADQFVLDILYQNDKAGTSVNYLPVGDVNNKALLSVMNLDRLNAQLDNIPNGRFDYIEGITVYSNKGRIVFPVLEPFGSYLKQKINDDVVAAQYIFSDLYEKTQSEAEQNSEKNKFLLKGSYKSSTSSEVSLGGNDIPRGSVQVIAGGVVLAENIDYTVDYMMGKVQIINQALLESGTPITIKSENRSLFGIQTKTLVGTHLDYKFNDKFNIGATIMHMNEKPMTHKVNIGNEPLSNTIWGLNASYRTESGLLTMLVDKLPFVNTKAKSYLTIDTEFAKFQPGISKGAGNNAYIDDFEGNKMSIDMKSSAQWKLASTPQDNMFPEGTSTDYRYGYNRAKLAWYVVDPIFYRMSSATPGHIRADKEQRSNHFVREIRQTEIFPNKDIVIGDINIIPALSLAYYPNEKGPYNFDAEGMPGVSSGVDRDGKLKDPATRWGGIMRSIQTNDFEAANVQYIEMWLMDPFVYDPLHKGGDMYIDLGNVSEDILRDGRKSFENGLPVSAAVTNVDSTVWGRVPKVQSIVNGFSNDSRSRRFQDVGLDGLSDEEERVFFASCLENLRMLYGENSKIYQDAYSDPAGDNYHYFRGSDFDAMELPVIQRYKKYNGTEGNSPTTEMSQESYSTSATMLPDVEDINGDNTLNETEAFFRYHLTLNPSEMEVGKNFINNITTAFVDLPDGTTAEVKWYQIRIPVSDYQMKHGGISDFKSIRFMRMIMKGFQDSVILRIASLDLVRDNWRKYDGAVDGQLPVAGHTAFDISVVSLEENASKTPVNYVMPSGIDRAVDAMNPQLRQLNEQAMALKVIDLGEGDAKAVYKNMGMDMMRYKTLRMDVHAEAIKDHPLDNDELTLFLRIGSDNTNNYYEYEIPLQLTPPGFYPSDDMGRESVWPASNRIELSLSWLQALKQRRTREAQDAGREINYTEVYQMTADQLGESGFGIQKHLVKIKGKPTLATIKTIMIGIRNPKINGVKGDRSAEVWVNELRLSDFDNKGGWAANARVTAKLADVATVSFAGSRITPGFGSIEQHANEIERKDLQSIDFSTSVEFGKFFPEKWRLRLPMYYAYSKQTILSEYDPLDTDVPLEVTLKYAETKRQRDSIRRSAEDYVMRKSLNFTNVGIESKDGRSRLFSLANLTMTYSYNESFARNVNTERDLEKDYRGLVSYTYNGMPRAVEPFKKVQFLNSKFWALLKDFNFYYMPSMLSVTSDITRNYREMELKNLDNPGLLMAPTYDKDFMWTRYVAFKFNLTKNLVLDFHATTRARIDEPEGIVDRQRASERYEQWKDTVVNNILDGGRPVNYNHDLTLQYTLPVNKLPGLDWTMWQTMYSTRYDWQAGALTADSVNLGNIIRNANSFQANVDLSFNALYNKSGLLRQFSTVPSSKRREVKFETNVKKLQRGRPVVIKHDLKTDEIKVKITGMNGKEIEVGYETVGKNKIRINPTQNQNMIKVVVTGYESSDNTPLHSFGHFVGGMLTGVKNISVSFVQDQGATLPGFLPEARWLGQQTYNGTSAPGFGFLFGQQDKHFGLEAAQNGWLTTDTTLNSPYLMNTTQTVYLKALVEPIKKLRINLTANWMKAESNSEYILYDQSSFYSANKTKTGNFSMTMIGLKSAFYSVSDNTGASLAVYNEFLENRKKVSEELAIKRYGDNYKAHRLEENGKFTGFYEGYGGTSQEVLTSAFTRAYGVKSGEGLIPQLLAMRPNWRVTYTGLMDIAIMRKAFKSFILNHAYICKYNIGSFSSNLKYSEGTDGFSTVRDMQNNWMAMYDVNTVSVNEQFNPLISMDMVWANNLTTRFDINRRRDISLSLVNAQLAEISSNETVVGVGYRFANLPIFLRNKQLDNDINIQCDFSMRKNNTIIRRITEKVDQLTAGQEVMSIRLSADYTFDNRLNLRIFYDRIVNTPYVSLVFPTTNTNFGISIKYTLMQ